MFLVRHSNEIGLAFAGLRDIDPEHTRTILAHVERDPLVTRPDPELEWMLPWYHMIASSFFDAFSKPIRSSGSTEPAPRERFIGRGQLGEYWIAVRQLA